MGGKRLYIALAITDLAVPRRPAIATPPSSGSTAAKSKASLIASCPTTAVRGKLKFLGAVVTADMAIAFQFLWGN